MAAVSGLSLESYLQIYNALTKNSGEVQSVTPIEECYYRVQDLRQLLSIHGLSTAKFNRTELLLAMRDRQLICPIYAHKNCDGQAEIRPPHSSSLVKAADDCDNEASNSDTSVTLTGADLQALGWAATGSDAVAHPLENSMTDLLAGFDDVPGVHNSNAALPSRASAYDIAPPAGLLTGDVATADVLQLTGPDQQPLVSSCAVLSQLMTAAQQPQTQALVQPPPTIHKAVQVAGTSTAPYKGTAATLQQRPLNSSSTQSAQSAQPVTAHLGSEHRATAVAAAAAVAKALQRQPVPDGGLSGLLICNIENTGPCCKETSKHGIVADVHAGHATQNGTTEGQSCEGEPQQQQQHLYAEAELCNSQAPEQMLSGEAAALCPAAAAAAADPPTNALIKPPSAIQVATFPHTHWLTQQLQLFAASGAAASQEMLTAAAPVDILPGEAAAGSQGQACGPLLGRRVGFVVTEDMLVAGPKSTHLTLPAGMYEGRVLKHLGSSCQPELCEASCPGGHEHYRARIIPPQLPDDDILATLDQQAAETLTQAHTAASGRPVHLILDLHPCLRSSTLEQLLELDAAKLQDAWVLIREEEHPSRVEAHNDIQMSTAASRVTSSSRGRGGVVARSTSRNGTRRSDQQVNGVSSRAWKKARQ